MLMLLVPGPRVPISAPAAMPGISKFWSDACHRFQGPNFCARTFSTNWVTIVRANRATSIAAGSANRPTRGRYGRDLNCLHHTQNNPTTKIREICPVAFSCKAGHSSFMGDNLKKWLQSEHCVCKSRGIQGHPHTELINFCALLRTLLPFPTPGPKTLIHFLNLFFLRINTRCRQN